MNHPADPPDVLRDIETLQDDVLNRLDDLNQRIEATLAEHGAPAQEPPGS